MLQRKIKSAICADLQARNISVNQTARSLPAAPSGSHIDRMTQQRMRTLLIRTLLTVSIGMLAAILVFRMVSPSMISAHLVRERMETSVENWLGHDIVIGDPPELSFWPRPVVTLRNITIRTEDRADAPILGHIGSLSARFSIWQALRGSPVFEDFTLVEPHLILTRDEAGHFNWGGQGLLGAAVREASRQDGNAVSLSRDPVIGSVTISHGSLLFTNARGETFSMNQIEGSLDWARLSAAARLRIQSVIEGHSVALDLSAADPLMLIGGRSTEINADVESALFSGSFRGSADLARYAFFAGDLKLSVPDVKAVADWARLPFHIANGLKDVSLSSKLVTIGNVLRFDQLALSANGTHGTGVMDLSMATEKTASRVTGTLAFDSLNLGDLVDAISGKDDQTEGTGQKTAASFEKQLGFDVRFSADQAQLGLLALKEAAVSVVSNAELAQIEILDSNVFGGSLTGDIKMSGGAQPSTRIDAKAANIDLAQLAKVLSLPSGSMSGTGGMTAQLISIAPMHELSADAISGPVTFTATSGSVSGLDLPRLEELAKGSRYFDLSQFSQGSTSFDRLDVYANLGNGTAEIDRAVLASPSYMLSLSGVIPYLTRSLSLSAELQNLSTKAAPQAITIGGTWPDPVLWPAGSAVTDQAATTGTP